VRFTKEGKQQLHDIFKALKDLEDSGLTAFEIQAKVDELMDELANVLATQLEPIPDEDGEDQPSSTSSSSATTTTVTATSTTSTSTSTSSSTTTTTSAATTTTSP
jgi:hypothetical protein